MKGGCSRRTKGEVGGRGEKRKKGTDEILANQDRGRKRGSCCWYIYMYVPKRKAEEAGLCPASFCGCIGGKAKREREIQVEI